MIRRLAAATCLAALPLTALAQDAVAPTPQSFSLELNNAATLDGSTCQLTYVANNASDVDLSQASYQVGFFDAVGVVRRILVLEFGALPPGKTRIVLFNLPEQSCEDLSRIVVNDVSACQTTAGEASDICLSALETSSLTDIQFGL
ncbi:MAG: hypothetical protein AAGE03_18570 [Pseudomonadota bacterium]